MNLFECKAGGGYKLVWTNPNPTQITSGTFYMDLPSDKTILFEFKQTNGGIFHCDFAKVGDNKGFIVPGFSILNVAVYNDRVIFTKHPETANYFIITRIFVLNDLELG